MAGGVPQNDEDFLVMQQEAIRRVRDMQRRARATLEGHGIPLEPGGADDFASPAAPPAPSPAPGGPRQTNAPTQRPSRAQTPNPHPPSSPGRPAAQPAGPPGGAASGLQGLLGLPMSGVLSKLPLFNLSLDSEQLILLGMIYMLFRDKGDPWLMLALGYILLFNDDR